MIRSPLAFACCVALTVLSLSPPTRGPLAQEAGAPAADRAWVRLSPLDATPVSPRLGYEGACVWDAAHRVLVRYGGHNQGGGGEQNAEVWSFDPATARWRLHEPNTSPPGVCCAQQNVFDPVQGRSVRFPAFSASHGWQWRREVWLNDSSVWTYDLGANTWRNLSPLPAPPIRPLRCASWDAEHEVIVVFGGEGSHEGTLVYDPWTNSWTRMRPANEPEARSGGNMAYDAARKVHVLFGSQFSDDPHTWTYDLRANEWRDRKPERMPPANKNDAVLAYDPARRVVVAIIKVTEGEDEDAKHRLETWTYDAGTNVWTREQPGSEPDPSGNRARVLVTAPELGGVLLENCTHPPQGKREQQVWIYRDAAAATSANEAPRAPSGLRLVSARAAVRLSWDADPAAVEGFTLYRGAGEPSWTVELQSIATLPAGTLAYEDAGIERGVVYHYAIAARGDGGREGPRSVRVRSQPRIVEDAVVTVRSAREVELRWEPPRGDPPAGYHVERAVVEVLSDDQLAPLRKRTPPLDPPSVGAIVKIGAPVRLTEKPIEQRAFTDREIDLSTPREATGDLLHERTFSDEQRDGSGRPYPLAVYAYRIRAVNALGVESGPSTPFFTIPSAPQHVFAREDGETCHLRWQPNPQEDLQGYRVYRMNGRYDNAPIARLTEEPVNGTELADTMAGTSSRRYYVIAVDALGQEGFPSAPVWFEREWKRFYEPFTGEWHQ